MAVSLMILADGPGADLLAHLGPAALALYARMLNDTLDVASSLPDARVTVCCGASLPSRMLDAMPATSSALDLRCSGAAAVGEALDAGLVSGGPVIVLCGNLPHLPPWRLRDAVTYLKSGVDLVCGPSDRGGWYMVGLSPAAAHLAHRVPAPDASLSTLLALNGHATHLLPPWFGITTVGDLASLVETMRVMPVSVAAGTRAMLEAGQASRAVGG